MEKNRNDSPENVMGIFDHLSEMRKRLFIIVGVFLVLSALSFNYVGIIVDVLIENSKGLGYELVYLAPGELFSQYIKISLIIGITVASPVILFQLWLFILPGLEKGEKFVVFSSLFSGLICFILGASFAYVVAVPMMFNFFMTVDQNQFVQATISIQNYINFVLSTLITFGIIFEMPVVTVLLSQLGILNPVWMTKSRKFVIVVLFVVGAVITPPDVVSQVLVAVPMLILFEISVLLSKMIARRKRKKELNDSEE